MDSLASKEEIENKRRTWLDCIEKVDTDVTSQMRGALAEVADDTLYLVDGAVFAPVSQERSLDPLASNTWEDVIEVLTLAFLRESHMRSNNWLPTPWAILAIIVLGFNESMLLLKNHLYLMALFIIFLLPKAGWTQLDIAGEFRLGAIENKKRTWLDCIEKVNTDVTSQMRGAFVDCFVEVADESKDIPDTLYLAVYCLDGFLSSSHITLQRLQLIGVSYMLIASSKFEEFSSPHVEDVCYITDHTYTEQEVVKMESDILNALRFEVGNPTAKTFLRRFSRNAQGNSNVTQHGIPKSSPIWHGIKSYWSEFKAYCFYIVGDGKKTHILQDPWVTPQAISEILSDWELPSHAGPLHKYIAEGEYRLDLETMDIITAAGLDMQQLPQFDLSQTDYIAWTLTWHGKFSFKKTYLHLLNNIGVPQWASIIWQNGIQASVMHKRVATDDAVRKLQVPITSWCSFCKAESETRDHLFWECPFTKAMWIQLSKLFKLNITGFSWLQIVNLADQSSKCFCSFWQIGVEIWKFRNKVRFKELKTGGILSMVRSHIRNASYAVKYSSCSKDEDHILKSIGRMTRAPKILEGKFVFWLPPISDTIKINTDGSFNNIDACGAGVVACDSYGCILGVAIQKSEYGSSFLAEWHGILLACWLAIKKRWEVIWIESDSVVHCFKSGIFRWELSSQFRNAWGGYLLFQ